MSRSRKSNSSSEASTPGRVLAVVFGDQLDLSARLLRELTPERDVVLMMEVRHESEHVASHVQRTVLFLSAMRHFAEELRTRGVRVRFVALDDPKNTHGFETEIARAVKDERPALVRCTLPGEWRVLRAIERACTSAGVGLNVLEDEHFLTSREAFASWAKNRRGLTMEFFYREQRKLTGYLMHDGEPEGGVWNFDKENRASFGAGGPKPPPPLPRRFQADAVTREVIDVVRRAMPGLPGRLEDASSFGWYVTREQALEALKDFVERRLRLFGTYEDAMWTGTPFVYHSVLSAGLNLKLLNPRECCDAAIAAYRKGKAPLQSVEAFVRQIIGWREFIRGVYWLEGDTYAERNGLDEHGALPEFYWTGKTDMACLRECVGQVLDVSFGHHIQRLMVTGNFALIAGVHPKHVSDWYLGMYVDGVDWVTLPNTLGMVMHADRRPDSGRGVTGLVGTKPYAASGKYIQRMSNYCKGCRYDVGKRSGDDACPFNVLYWDFLTRHRERLGANQRMAMILKNVDRMSERERVEIRVSAAKLRDRFGISGRSGPEVASGPVKRQSLFEQEA